MVVTIAAWSCSGSSSAGTGHRWICLGCHGSRSSSSIRQRHDATGHRHIRPLTAQPRRWILRWERTAVHALQTSIITTYALASRVRASWMEARVTKVARVSARFSKSLESRRFRPNQEKVRSTTQRRGRMTKPFVAALNELHAQQRHLGEGGVNLPGVVAAISPDQFEPWEAPPYLVEHQPGAVAVLDRGRVNNHPHRQSFGIDQGVDLAAFHLLAGVVTHRVVFTAPFSADFTDWLSRTAADGLASRLIRSRNAIYSSARIASQTPSR